MSIGKCGNDCAECAQSCLNCNGTYQHWDRKPKYKINFSYFKPYFDVTLGKEVSSKHEIDEYCKRNDMVYAGDKELTQQCQQNKAENERNHEVKFIDGLTQDLSRVL